MLFVDFLTFSKGLLVPRLLVLLKNSLIKYDAFEKEGIFRLAASTDTCAQLRRQLDKDLKEFKEHSDVYTVATLIKLWYRELPNPLFSSFSKEELYFEDPEKIKKAVEKMPEPNRTLLEWLITLMELVFEKKDINKMTIENLGISITFSSFFISHQNWLFFF